MLEPQKFYLSKLERALKSGKTTEHTHRSALEAFVESLASHITATNEPKRIACGAPDIAVSRAPGPVTVGYIEAKDVGKSLDEAARSEQLRRYLRSIGNLILTDYLEFRWYVDGKHRLTTRLARFRRSGKLAIDSAGATATVQLLQDFLAHRPEPIATPKELAERMARLTHLIRDIIIQAFTHGRESQLLRDLRGAFAKILIPDLDRVEKTAEFADMYAQTIAYGLFAARCNHHGSPQTFQRVGAASEIPKTNPFLRRLFETVTGADLDEEAYAGFVDDLVQVLAHADIDAILAHFGTRIKREDPVLHFYETFLATYDPALRERRGVYYTPEPVVAYIVRSVDYLLRQRFGLSDGIADTATVSYEREEIGKLKAKPRKITATAPRVLVLDPACGTGTFLYSAIDHIRDDFMRHGNAGMWSGYVKRHLLPRLFGFELLMAPYAIAHFKLGMQLAGQDLEKAKRKSWAYDFSGDERLGVYLTNTLEAVERQVETLFGPLRVISEEANAAAHVKRDMPILVVIGNPPYSGISANKGDWINGLLRGRLPDGTRVPSYYEVDGKPIGEKKVWLQDDYVKFLRWGQWRIERTGAGILAFITNHGYLDNPTFRGMRRALMNAFTAVYTLNLHGSTKKRERVPGGMKDDNVFDIQQGVAISVFVKEPGKSGPATIHHADLWGPRETKYEWLHEHGLDNTPWTKLDASAPFYFFVPRAEKHLSEYEGFCPITEVMPVYVAGIVSARDHVVFDFNKAPLLERIRVFRDPNVSDRDIRETYFPGKRSTDYPPGDTRGWKLPEARKKGQGDPDWETRIVPCLYHPFDVRYLYYTEWMVDWPRSDVMAHLINRENVGLSTTRSVEIGRGWEHVFCADQVTQHHTVSQKEVNYLFPLYLYPGGAQAPLFDASPWSPGEQGRRPNLSPKFVADLESRIGLKFGSDGPGDLQKTFGPEDVLGYIYALFHSPTYRTRYAEFLKRDFARVPPTSDRALFRGLCTIGRELLALHLLKSPALAKLITRYPVNGDNLVDKGYPEYSAQQQRVSINDKQYFERVPSAVWDFHVGGYQVCYQWLKDRRGLNLSYQDLATYQKIIVAVSEMLRYMRKIDETIPSWPLP